MKHLVAGLYLTVVFWGYGRTETMAGDKKEPAYQGKPLGDWVKLLKDRNPRAREEATVVLAKMGPDARPAIPDLIETLKDDEFLVRLNAAGALGKIGPAAVPALIETLKKGKPRQQAAKAPKLPPLARGTGFYESCAREGAAMALGIIGPEAKAAVPVLISTLNDEDAGVRFRAAEALGRVGPEAMQAVPALFEAMKDKDKNVSEAAAGSVKKIDPGAAAKARGQ